MLVSIPLFLLIYQLTIGLTAKRAVIIVMGLTIEREEARATERRAVVKAREAICIFFIKKKGKEK